MQVKGRIREWAPSAAACRSCWRPLPPTCATASRATSMEVRVSAGLGLCQRVGSSAAACRSCRRLLPPTCASVSGACRMHLGVSIQNSRVSSDQRVGSRRHGLQELPEPTLRDCTWCALMRLLGLQADLQNSLCPSDEKAVWQRRPVGRLDKQAVLFVLLVRRVQC